MHIQVENKECHNILSLQSLCQEVDGIMVYEEWASIKGFENYYEISSFGRVKGLKRTIVRIDGNKQTIKQKILKQVLTDDGYLSVGLRKISSRVTKKVHRLVGIRFIDNPKNKPEINHLFGNKRDNRFFMLEWATGGEQREHSYRVLNNTPPMRGRTGKKSHLYGRFGANSNHFKKIYCPTLGISFSCVNEASDALGIHRVFISRVINGHLLQKNGLNFVSI